MLSDLLSLLNGNIILGQSSFSAKTDNFTLMRNTYGYISESFLDKSDLSMRK